MSDTRNWELLEFDSDFFGIRIARADAVALVRHGGAELSAWCTRERVACVYLLADATDQAAIVAAETGGFRLVDLRVTLASPVGTTTTLRQGSEIRPAEAGDVTALKRIARDGHHDTRFYVDGRFDRQRCDELYELWIDKSCHGWADQVFVAECDGLPVGYLTCHLRDGHGQIGLVGVDAGSRGRGYGLRMLETARCWFGAQGAGRMSVVTQGRNAGGLRLYQRAGMTVSGFEFWFHKWL